MIRIHYDFDRNHHDLYITGHAGYAPRGQDIVCAAVSGIACALMAYASDLKALEKKLCRPGELKLRCSRSDETDVAFDMAMEGYQCIARTYPQYVEVNTTLSEESEEEECMKDMYDTNTTGNTFHLQLFADGAEGLQAQAVPTAETNGRAGSSRRLNTGESTAQPSAAGEAQGTDTADKRKAFRALIEGEYKEQYAELFQNAFNRRFKEAKTMESRLKEQQPVLDLLARRYNVPSGDMARLHAAIEEDGSYWKAAAEKAGMSVEQYRQFEKLREDSRQLQQLRSRQQAGQQLAGWLREAAEVRGRYPSFDLRAELADGQFRKLLRSGVGVGQAYELRHMEDIKAAAARAAAQSAGEQMAARIQSRGLRPRENGISQQSAVITKSGVHNLTPAQRKEIARRVQRGDKIRF